MKQLSRVLTAVDFSAPARVAFDHALVLSRMQNAELTVVHAVPKDRPFRGQSGARSPVIAELRQAAEAAGVRLKVRVQHGDPTGVILLHARARQPDLIVLGTHQRTGLDRFRVGSVAEAVTLRATQPVLIVPPSPDGASAESVLSFNSIVVAVDFSAGSIAAVERALSMASAHARVTLVHVVPGVPPATASRYTYHLSEPEYQRLLARDAWRRLQSTISATARTARRVHARVVTGGPAAEIARIATDVDADLIVVGVTPRGVLGRRVFGSTAARVIRTAGRPVLAIPELANERAASASEEGLPAIAA